uniref:(northern house mosquito) hypothetical protein n=1 Tax=Culex pipiens TaxID=7175 RepID=A0A8D8AVZ9_CULPI
MVTSWKGSQQNGTVSSGRESLSSMLLRGRPYLPSLPLRRRPESRDDRHHSGVYIDTGKSRHHAAGPKAIADRVLAPMMVTYGVLTYVYDVVACFCFASRRVSLSLHVSISRLTVNLDSTFCGARALTDNLGG